MKDEQYNLCLYKVHLKETLILRLLKQSLCLCTLPNLLQKNIISSPERYTSSSVLFSFES